ncbi:hypothetical protein Tco_0439842 [Tanacetum coccineum]
MEKILNMKFVIVLLMVMTTSAFVTRGLELNWDGKKYCSNMVCKLGTGDVFCTADCSPRGWTHGECIDIANESDGRGYCCCWTP